MKIRTFCEAVAQIVNMATALLIAALTLFVSWQVFARYVLNAGQFWAEELAVIVMIWIGILGASSTLWSESHIGLNVIVDRLPETGKVMARVFSDFLIAGFGIYLFIYGLQLVNKITGTWSALRISIGMTYIIVPVSAALLVLFALSKGALRLAEHFTASQDTSTD